MAEPKDLCVKAAKGPIVSSERDSANENPVQTSRGSEKMMARVGKPAPDFEASAFVEGGFKNIKLSDYRGKWVVICFYPGDFTFV